MKILYAIQGTGNGHLSRAKDVIPALQKRAEVDLLISGIQADIDLPYEVKYRYKGLCFIFGKKGSIDMYATFKSNKIRRFYNEIKSCPVRDYDLVINDFEPISAWAAKLHGVPCFSLSHQGALQSPKVPRPQHKDWLGLFILNHYAPANKHYSFHFKKYDKNMFTPVIRSEVRDQKVSDNGHITVYLPAYGDKKLIKVLKKIPTVQFEVFSKHTKRSYIASNLKIRPINAQQFSASMASSSGVLCGAGFETPAETLFLNKKLLVIPMKRQFEQHFNAAGLQELGVSIIPKLSKKYLERIEDWISNEQIITTNFPDETQYIVDQLLAEYNNYYPIKLPKRKLQLFPKLEFLGL